MGLSCPSVALPGFGVYALAQGCIVTAYWCVFRLGSAIVGPPYAALAVLLMVGISPFTVPSPDFGPPILTMALWAIVLLNYWRAIAEGNRRAWYALGAAAAAALAVGLGIEAHASSRRSSFPDGVRGSGSPVRSNCLGIL